MNRRACGIGAGLVVGLAIGLLGATVADARGSRGGRSGGHASRPSHASAPRRPQAYKPPRMPRASAPARSNSTRSNHPQNHAHGVQTHANKALVGANTGATPTHSGTATSPSNHLGNAQTLTGRAGTATTPGNRAAAASVSQGAAAGLVGRNGIGTTTGTGTGTGTRVSSPTATGVGTTGLVGTTGVATTPTYTYGTGVGSRRYRAYGYGSGYRNRSYGGRYGYGRSQGNNRAIVSRLRSVHSALAQVDHDYQGHRVRAMHSISMAVRQLSHRSMVYGGVGFQSGLNNNMAPGMRANNGVNGNGNGAGVRGNRRQPMTQAQSDARVSQALRSLQGIQMQLANQGSYTTGHSRAGGHVQHAVQELNTALRVR